MQKPSCGDSIAEGIALRIVQGEVPGTFPTTECVGQGALQELRIYFKVFFALFFGMFLLSFLVLV